MSSLRSKQLISQLNLQAHPEGGWFREVYRSRDRVVSNTGNSRSAVTTIYYLLTEGTFSRWHRVRSEEIWHHLEGGPMELLLFTPDFSSVQRVVLGPLPSSGASGEGSSSALTSGNGNSPTGSMPMHVVPANWWQACRPLEEYGLASCTVAPGFEFEDFAFLSEEDPGGERLAQLDSSLLELL